MFFHTAVIVQLDEREGSDDDAAGHGDAVPQGDIQQPSVK